MPPPTTKMVRAVEAAAALRAAGHSWPHIAEALGRSPQTVRQWPRRFRELWARAAAATRRDLFLGAGGEALNTLRNLLRSDDERTRRDVGRELLHLPADDPPADEPAARTPFHALADYLGGLTDDQRRQLLDHELAQARRRAADEPALPEAA